MRKYQIRRLECFKLDEDGIVPLGKFPPPQRSAPGLGVGGVRGWWWEGRVHVLDEWARGVGRACGQVV